MRLPWPIHNSPLMAALINCTMVSDMALNLLIGSIVCTNSMLANGDRPCLSCSEFAKLILRYPMKEDRAIVFHCNRDHVFALGAMLYNLAERSVSCSRIIVYTDFDDDAVFEKLCAVNGNMEFHCYPLDCVYTS